MTDKEKLKLASAIKYREMYEAKKAIQTKKEKPCLTVYGKPIKVIG